jgi:6-phosphofructokinase 1
MEKKVNTIGVLTSGGDAPGMNAAVRSVVRTALFHGIQVKGILKGYNGLMSRNYYDMKNGGYMDLRSVSGVLEEGGTVLYSARCPEFREDAGVEKGKQSCITDGIDGLVVIGGDGSFRGARDLSLKGIPCIGIPATIDNDIACTNYSIGFDTAMNTALENIDKLRDTSEALDRCTVVEVMGHRCGDLALHAAICSGAVSALIPENPIDLQRDVIAKMKHTLATGKSHFIVIVAEGVFFDGLLGEISDADKLACYISEHTGVESRATVIGHVQRGGSPSARDRVVASRMGHYAVELLKQGVGNRVVAMQNDDIVDYDILEALQMKRPINQNLVRIANEISI